MGLFSFLFGSDTYTVPKGGKELQFNSEKNAWYRGSDFYPYRSENFWYINGSDGPMEKISTEYSKIRF